MSLNPEKSHTHSLKRPYHKPSLLKGGFVERSHSSETILFLNGHLEEVQSLRLLGLALRHDLFWAIHISKLADTILYL